MIRSFSGIRNSMSKSTDMRDQDVYLRNQMYHVAGVQGE